MLNLLKARHKSHSLQITGRYIFDSLKQTLSQISNIFLEAGLISLPLTKDQIQIKTK